MDQGQERNGAHTDTRKGHADRQPAPAHEPVGQEQRLAGVAKARTAAAHQNAQRLLEMPRLCDEWRPQQPGRHQIDTSITARGPHPVHHATDQRAQDRENGKAKGEGPGGDATIPVQLFQDGRNEEGKRGACVDPDTIVKTTTATINQP